MGPAVFKTVARPFARSRVGSTPMRLRQNAFGPAAVRRVGLAHAAEWVVLGGLLLAAGAIRLRELSTAPSWTDEVREVFIALDMVEGLSWAVSNTRVYIGPLWNYLLAGAFAVFGLQPELPRLVALAFGVATLVATYFLARRLGGPTVGIIAAALLAVSGGHVLVNSRIAWSHSITPLFSTLAFWLLLGVSLKGGPRLVAAGLACGLAIQTHVTAVASLPAITAFVLLWRREWLRSRWLWLGALAFLFACANLLVFNLFNGPDFLSEQVSRIYGATPAQEIAGSSGGRGARAWEAFLANTGRGLLTYARVLSGAVDIRSSAAAYLTDPLVIAPLLLLLVGLVKVTRRVSALPALVLAAWGLLLVFVLKEHEVIPHARYLMPIVPLSLALVACGIAGCCGWLVRRPAIKAALVMVMAGPLLFGSWARLDARMGDLKDSIQVSSDLAGLFDVLSTIRGPADPVYFDPELQRLWLDGGGSVSMALRYRARLTRMPVSQLLERRDRVPDDRFEIDGCAANRAVLQPLQIGAGDRLERLIPAGEVPAAGTRVWLVRVAEPRETVADASAALRHRPPIGASGRAVVACARGRLI